MSDTEVEVDERELDGGEEEGVEGAEGDKLLRSVEAESVGPGERDVSDGDRACVCVKLAFLSQGGELEDDGPD